MTMSWILSHEPGVRLGAFIGVFAVMALWEAAAARRELRTAKGSRWFANLGITVLNTVVLRLVFPAAAVGVAAVAADRGWGLFNNLAAPPAIAIIGSVLVLDLVIYLQHVMFHAVPALWRLHMVHHADLDFDVTTGLRFHPLEIVLSMVIKFAAVVLLGPPAVAVLIFEVLLNATSMFNHGNVRIPLALDHVVRWFVVTPDMHRVHHSIDQRETNSNFGFNLPWWDRLLGTYRAQPAAGHEAMTIGLEQFQERRRQTLPWLVALPFAGRTGEYPMGRRQGS
jgi:sterol desaturase/sphingolipid hydroxylase (fatty acid hydroxylase superfamily)